MTPSNHPTQAKTLKEAFKKALDWVFSQIIAPDDMLPRLDDQKEWLLKQHQAAVAEAVREARKRQLEMVIARFEQLDDGLEYAKQQLAQHNPKQENK